LEKNNNKKKKINLNKKRGDDLKVWKK